MKVGSGASETLIREGFEQAVGYSPRRANHRGLGNVTCGSASLVWRTSRRKREALAVLKQMLEIDPEAGFDPNEPDLQPLAAIPKFKAMKENMKETNSPADEVKPAKLANDLPCRQ